ncbi:amino acid permease-domain-containing protein [Fusarium solani]|uniref:Amino acid permease-domain-containing protein n=1 Tax=Fusarium solani TaxID=169388 RepID=A0A9P9GJ97_FUSSL|nr:amino acid permease-domain-containing protein [Fusarium solani]KAH7240460.1 amino acid permease-domain-containing protein [Fusarium solani]
MTQPQSTHPQVRRPGSASTLSATSVGATTTNSAIGVILSFYTTLSYGGSVLLFYGFLAMAFVGLCTAVTLGELSAGFPDVGGQYVWAARMSPHRYRRFLSYMCALLSWGGAICVGAATCLIAPLLVFQAVAFFDPSFVYKPWMGFLAYQGVNLLTLIPSLFEYLLPKSAESFFTNFYNTSGWPAGVAVLIGMNSLNWCFSCLDSVVHLSEEIPNPRRNIPRALMWSIVVGAATGVLIIFAFIINNTDYETRNSAIPMIYYTFRSKGAAIALLALLIVSTIGAQWGIHVWQSRLAWSIGIDKGLPMHDHLSRVAGAPFGTPIWALLFSAAVTSVLGCLYLASERAFNSFTGAGLLFQYSSYVIPVVMLHYQGRSSFPHGDFWFPRFRCVANLVMCAWVVVALIFYCFPYSFPVVTAEMNYVSVAVGVFLFLIMISWFSYGRKHITFPDAADLVICIDEVLEAARV